MPLHSSIFRHLSIFLFFFFSCLFFLRNASVAQAIMLWHMLLFAFGPAYATFWCFCVQLCSFLGGQTSKNVFNRQLRYFMVVSGVHTSVVVINVSDLACIKHNRVVKAAGRAFMRFVAHLMLLCLLCCALCLFFAEHCLFSDMLFHMLLMPR